MKKKGLMLLALWMGISCLAGCSKEEDSAEMAEKQPVIEEATGLEYETAKDGHIDFGVLQQQNPEIFAWLYVPGTNIDVPVLQSGESDEYYKVHGADGKENSLGALYTEMANLMNMCDFNTIIHGQDETEENLFYELHFFENPEFFQANTKFYIYLPDNVLTYEIITAYYDEGSDLLRRYDYTTFQGCQDYIESIYGARDMSKNIREGWEELTPYHFLVTLDGEVREDNTQYVVIGALVGDAAGTIDRVILD